MSAENLYTKGNWIAFVGDDQETIEIQLENGKPIIRWGGFDSLDIPYFELVANAHLIRTAPKLYAMLENLLQNEVMDKSRFEAASNILAEARGEHGR